MLGMFWIALELSSPMIGLITRLSLLAKTLTTFKFGKVVKSGNAASTKRANLLKVRWKRARSVTLACRPGHWPPHGWAVVRQHTFCGRSLSDRAEPSPAEPSRTQRIPFTYRQRLKIGLSACLRGQFWSAFRLQR